MHKRKVLITVVGILFIAGVSLVYTFKKNYCVPILMYHSVNPEAKKNNRLAVSVVSFERQMRFLKATGYTVVPLETLYGMLSQKQRIPLKTVALTFDDGYKDNYIYAFPILQKYRLPATIFIIVNEVGRPQGDRLSWDDLLKMRDSGLVSFGSHCLGSEPLINLTRESQAKQEIFDSKRILEERLGRPVAVFSYPEGRFTEKIRQLVRQAGYVMAVATNPGKEFSNDDMFALKRLRISSSSDNLIVFWIEASGFYTFIKEHRHK